MNGIAPGLDGFLAQRQFAGREQNQQLNQMQGMLGLQQAMTQQQQLQKDQELKGLLGQKLQTGDMEGAKGILMQMKPELFAASLVPKQQEAFTLTPGAMRFGPDGKRIAAAPMKDANPSDLSRLMAERDSIPMGDPRRATYDNAIRKASETAKQISPTVINQQSPYFQPVQTAQGVMAFNARTGQLEPVKVGGAPVIGAQADPRLQGDITGAKERAKVGVEQGEEARKANKRIDQFDAAVTQAESLLKKNPTGSGIGAVADMAGRAVGMTSESAKTAAELEALSGWLVSNVPRMEGPQSNIDVQNYQTMAAKVGDRTIPVAERQSALKGVRNLQQKYRSINEGERRTEPRQSGQRIVVDY